MRKIATLLAFVTACIGTIAQNISSDNVLIRKDTMLLKASECNWMIKSLQAGDQNSKTIPEIILQAVHQHKQKAIDPFTGDTIPGDRILTWRMSADTIATPDNAGNLEYNVIQRVQNLAHFTLIRVYQDWYFDKKTGMIRSAITSFELLKDIYTPMGSLIGSSVFCRIYNGSRGY